jgi:O-antigen ligase
MLFYLTVLPASGLRLLRREAWPTDPGSLAAAALLGWFTLTTCWDFAAGAQLGVHALWVWNGVCTLVFVIGARLAFGAEGTDRNRLITILIVGALVNTVIILARLPFTGLEGGRLGGWAETRHPILGASMIGASVILAAGRLLEGRSRYLAAAAAIGGIAFILLTGSRGPLIAIAASLALLLAFARPRLLAAALVAALLLLGVVALADPALLQHAWARLLERGWSSRLDIWQLAIEEIGRRPLLGYGPSARLDRATDNFPHNLFLSTLFYSGAIGFLLLLAVIGLASRSAWRMPDRVGRATCLALLSHLVLSGVSDLGQVSKGPGPMWYIMWLPIILSLGPTTGPKPREIHLAERSGA